MIRRRLGKTSSIAECCSFACGSAPLLSWFLRSQTHAHSQKIPHLDIYLCLCFLLQNLLQKWHGLHKSCSKIMSNSLVLSESSWSPCNFKLTVTISIYKRAGQAVALRAAADRRGGAAPDGPLPRRRHAVVRAALVLHQLATAAFF